MSSSEFGSGTWMAAYDLDTYRPLWWLPVPTVGNVYITTRVAAFPAGAAIRVGLLQGNIDQSLKWDRSYQTATLDIYERLTRRVAVGKPALIVWPETAAPKDGR